MRGSVRLWIALLLRRSHWERELREELEFHIRARADHLTADGVPPEQALRRARLEFGPVERWKERCREARGAWLLDEVVRNLRDAWRSAVRSPGFVTVAVLSLALGIGANIATFGLLRELLLNPLPVRDPEGLQQVALSTVRRSYYTMPYPKFATLRDEFPIFDTIFGWGTQEEVQIAALDRAEPGRITLVTGSFFDGMGLRPAMGRLITPQDDRPGGGANVVVLSSHIWHRLFNADPGAIGRTIRVRDLTLQVIGVVPPEFAGPEPAVPADIYVPVHAMQPSRPNLISGPGLMWMHVMTRLKPDVPVETAERVLRERWSEIDRVQQARRGDNTRPEYMILEDGSHGYSSVRIEFSQPVVVLMGLVAIVFLIACANLASLLFVRASRRSGELALRVALGAGRGAIVRQWLTECLLLALVGGAAGLLTARWITPVLLQFVPEANRGALEFEATPEVLLFATLLSVGAACLFGWIPAFRAARVNANDVLRAHAPSLSAARGRIAGTVLALQLAASLILVAGAVLFARTMWNLGKQSTGFDREAVVYARPQLFRMPGFDRKQVPTLMQRILLPVEGSRSFTSIAVGQVPSGGAGGWGWARVAGYTFAPGEDNVAYSYFVSPGFFRTLSIPLIAGRDFVEADATAKLTPVIVSEKLARHYFSGRDPIGAQIAVGAAPPAQIIGVARDIVDVSLRTPPNELIYRPMSLYSFGDILARVAPNVDPAEAERQLRAAVESAAKGVPLQTGRVEDVIQASLERDWLVTGLSAALGLIGVLLACIGLFGAVAHWATGRTREMGIRMVLGATRGQIAWMVLRQGLIVTGLGLAVGLPLSLAAATLIRPLLFGVSPADFLTHAISALFLTLAGLIAACWPALRAASLNPLEALRYE